MGSRGLSFAVLCAQLLVAQIGAEPWPVEASLARSLHSTRTRRGKSAA
jgi:tRNA 5-methylaminomethyl-2-thiouridine biosynthesis bifunctional protein